MDALQKKMEDKRKNIKKKFGKPSTVRSEKKKLKKKEEKVEILEDTKDQLMYLGLDLNEIPETTLSIDS